jgi:serine phosphatase RsbU (regulator of sigma subunit)
MLSPPPGADPVRWLLTVSHRLPPAEVPRAVARAASLLGVEETVVYLADFAQQLLVPFLAPGERPRRPITIDGSVAGAAFRTEEVHRSTLKGPTGPATTVWAPVVDGADRLGVLALTWRIGPPPDEHELQHVATVAASLIVAKGMYSDVIGNTRGRDALDVAAELQWTFMPPRTYTGPSVTIAGSVEPAYEIAGDCFDYSVAADEVHLALFDAMGHGLEASRMANLTLATYRQCRRQSRSFADTYRLIDRSLDDQFGGFRFVTALLAVLHLGDGTLDVCAAGHPPPLVVRPGSVLPIDCQPARPMGLGGDPPATHRVQLERDDTVVLFTDGVVESRSPSGELFGTDRLVEQLRTVRPSEATSETVRRTLRAVVDHGQGHLRDDATILLARWEGPDRRW